MDFLNEFKKRFKDAQDLFPGELWIVLVVIVLAYALIATIIAMWRGKKLKEEREKNHLYQKAVLKQEGSLKALEADRERDEYLKKLKAMTNRE